MSLILETAQEIASQLAKQAQTKRLAANLSQNTLAQRSGVSLGVLKKFEHTGKISLESLLKLAQALESLEEFKDLFKPTPLEHYASLDELLNLKKRRRGRK